MNENRLVKGIFRIVSANALGLLLAVGTAFLLPKYLSVETYSQIKTYQLYITYTAIFHLGYHDGMILKYGGKTLASIDKQNVQADLSTGRIFQIVMTGICMGTAFLTGDAALFMAACTILPLNMISYFRNLYQAIGEYEQYSRITNWTTILTFVMNLLLVGVIRTDWFVLYLTGYLLLHVWIWIWLEHKFNVMTKTSFMGSVFCWPMIKENLSSGFLLLSANISSMLLTGMDRFFVKGLMGTVDFAMYAFAASMENFLRVLVDPVSVSLYHYFCISDKEEVLEKVKVYILIFAAVLPAGVFPVKLFVELFLQDYMESANIMVLLFGAHMYLCMIRCFYVNLYKARKKQKRYAVTVVMVITLAGVFNMTGYYFYPQKEVFAVGTLLSAVVWFVLCQRDFLDKRCSLNQNIFLAMQTGVFLLTGFCMPAVTGMLCYGSVTLILIGIFFPDGYRNINNKIRKIR